MQMFNIPVIPGKCWWIVFTVIFCSCQPDSLSPSEMVRWVENEENGLIVTREVGEIIYKLKFQPIDYKLAKDLIDLDKKIDPGEMKRKKYGGLEYYTLGMTTTKNMDVLHVNNFSELDYSMKQEYFNTVAENDIELVVESDTFPCAIYQFEQTYGLSKYNNILMAFETSDTTFLSDRQLVFNDQLLGTGIIKFNLKSNNIKNTPNLKI
jgi:hypothetical protein